MTGRNDFQAVCELWTGQISTSSNVNDIVISWSKNSLRYLGAVVEIWRIPKANVTYAATNLQERLR